MAECVSAMCMINAVMTPSKVGEGEVEGRGGGGGGEGESTTN